MVILKTIVMAGVEYPLATSNPFRTFSSTSFLSASPPKYAVPMSLPRIISPVFPPKTGRSFVIYMTSKRSNPDSLTCFSRLNVFPPPIKTPEYLAKSS